MKKLLTVFFLLSSFLLSAQTYFDDIEGKSGLPLLGSGQENIIIRGLANVNDKTSGVKLGFGIYTAKSRTNFYIDGKLDTFKVATEAISLNSYSTKSSIKNYKFNQLGRVNPPIERQHTGYRDRDLLIGLSVSGKSDDGIASLVSDGLLSPNATINPFLGIRWKSFGFIDATTTKQRYTILGFLSGSYSRANYRYFDPDSLNFRYPLNADSTISTANPKETIKFNGWSVSANFLSVLYPNGKVIKPILVFGASLGVTWKNNYSNLRKIDLSQYNVVRDTLNSYTYNINEVDKEGNRFALGRHQSFLSLDFSANASVIPAFTKNRLALIGYYKVSRSFRKNFDEPQHTIGFQLQFLKEEDPLSSIAGVFIEWNNFTKANIAESDKADYRALSIGLTTSFNIFENKLKPN
jgi:hypothetical protein